MSNPEVPRPITQEPQKGGQERSFQNILDFLAEATPTPINLRTSWPPLNKNQTETYWQRNFTIAGRYFGTGESLYDIGGDDLSRERIRQIVKKVVTKFHANASQEMQERFPLESFDFDKSHTLEGKQEQSRKHGGRSLEVAQLVTQDKSAPEIRKTLGISAETLSVARRTLGNWGVEVPREQKLRERFASLADPELSDEEVRKILDTVTRRAYQLLTQGENPLLTLVSKVAKDAGLFFGTRDIEAISAVLERANIPVGFVLHRSYRRKLGEQTQAGLYLIRTLDTNRTISELEQSAEVEYLKTNRFTVLGKPSQERPTASEILNSYTFASVMSLIDEIYGRRIGSGRKIKLTEIVADNCPISIFAYYRGKRSRPHRNFRYRVDQKEELKAYLSKHLKELGLL